jgi:hypothetical protein
LTRQLVEISALAEELSRCARHSAAFHFYRQLCNRGSLHVLARERFLLPAWRKAGWKNLSSECLAAHFQFKHALADLLVSPPGKPRYAGCLAAFMRAAKVQHDLDEKVLVPSLREGVPLHERRLVFNDIDTLYATHDGAEHAPPVSPDATPWQSLMEEAHVVLSSLSRGQGAEGGQHQQPAGT